MFISAAGGMTFIPKITSDPVCFVYFEARPIAAGVTASLGECVEPSDWLRLSAHGRFSKQRDVAHCDWLIGSCHVCCYVNEDGVHISLYRTSEFCIS